MPYSFCNDAGNKTLLQTFSTILRNDMTSTHTLALEYFEFFTIWLRLQSSFVTKLHVLFTTHLTPLTKKLFDYLTFKVEYVVYPFGEISILGLQFSLSALASLSLH